MRSDVLGEVLRAVGELRAEWAAESARLRAEVIRLREEMAALRLAVSAPTQQLLPFGPVEQLVTLDQMAAIVGKRRRSLERYKGQLPEPRIPGRRGRAAQWAWPEVRPWLVENFSVQLPEAFPTLPEAG